MAKQVSLTASPRPELGKGATGRLRKTGRTPGVMYGHGVEPTPVHVDGLELYHALHTEAGVNAMIKLELEGETQLCIAREIQRHPVMGDITHLDFLSLDKNVAIVVELPVHLIGEAEVGAVVQQVLTTVPVLVKPLEVPTYVEVSVEGLTYGDVLRVGDLALPDGVEADMDADRTIVTVNAPQTLAVEDDESEDSEPVVDNGNVLPAEGDAE